jgi:hypothetical protein
MEYSIKFLIPTVLVAVIGFFISALLYKRYKRIKEVSTILLVGYIGFVGIQYLGGTIRIFLPQFTAIISHFNGTMFQIALLFGALFTIRVITPKLQKYFMPSLLILTAILIVLWNLAPYKIVEVTPGIYEFVVLPSTMFYAYFPIWIIISIIPDILFFAYALVVKNVTEKIKGVFLGTGSFMLTIFDTLLETSGLWSEYLFLWRIGILAALIILFTGFVFPFSKKS